MNKITTIIALLLISTFCRAQLSLNIYTDVSYSNTINLGEWRKYQSYDGNGLLGYSLGINLNQKISEKQGIALDFGMTRFGHMIKDTAGFGQLPFSNSNDTFPKSNFTKFVYTYYKIAGEYNFSLKPNLNISFSLGYLKRIPSLTYEKAFIYFPTLPNSFGNSGYKQYFTTNSRKHNIYLSLSLRYEVHKNIFFVFKPTIVPLNYYTSQSGLKLYHYSLNVGLFYSFNIRK